MGMDGVVPKRGAVLGGTGGMLLEEPADAEAGEGVAADIEEKRVGGAGRLRPMPEVLLDGLEGLLPEREGAVFPALSGQGDGAGGLETYILYTQISEFLDARTGVVEELKEGPVALAEQGSGLRGTQEGGDFLGAETGRGQMVGAFELDGLDLLVLVHEFGNMKGQEPEEGLDGAQALISGNRAVAPLLLEALKELEDQGRIDVGEVDGLRVDVVPVAEIADEQPHTVAVAGNGVRGEAAFGGQIGGEKGRNQVAASNLHWDCSEQRVAKRWKVAEACRKARGPVWR
jgi:hypothetical protein